MSIEIISAGAGSGKTYSLTEKMFKLLRDGKTTPPKILALTYLKRAAAELQERVSAKLIENNRPDLALQMQSARIGTVHSVCAEFLRQFSFELGESPDLKPIDEASAIQLFEEALNFVFTEDKNESILPVLYKLGDSDSIDSFKSNIRKAATLCRKNGIDKAGLEVSKDESLKLAGRLFMGGVKLLPRLQDSLNVYMQANPQCASTTKVNIKYHELVEKTHQASQNRQLSLADMLNVLLAAPGKRDAEAFADILSLTPDLLVSEELKEVAIDYVTIFFDSVNLVIETYQKIKLGKGVIDYEDMEVKMLQLLEIPAVADRLKDEIDLLLVDEFQDTPPIQLAIFKKLTSICKEVIWVGDTKQSILGYAGADPLLMQSLVASIKSLPGGLLTILPDNWRSDQKLVSFCNQVFSEALAHDGFKPAEVTLNAKCTHYKTPINFEVWMTENGNKAERSKGMAKGIQALLNSKILVTDKFTKKQRQIQGSDIAVLYRGNPDCSELAGNLNELGIHTSLALGDFLSSPEVALLLSSYSFTTDRRNTVAAAEAAMIFAETQDVDKILAKIALKDKVETWSPIIEKIQNLQVGVRTKSPGLVLSEIIEQLDLVRFVSRFEDADQKVSNIQLIQELAQRYEQSCFESLQAASHPGFVRYLNELDSVEKDNLAGNSASKVNILTMHRSKGLEWAVVILGNINGSTRDFDLFQNHIIGPAAFDPDQPLAGRRLQFVPWMFADKKNVPDVFLPRVQSEEQNMAAFHAYEGEQRRLLYVAMTRARELMIFDIGKNPTISPAGHLHCLRDTSNKYTFSFDLVKSEIKTSKDTFKANYRTFNYEENDWQSLRPKSKISEIDIVEKSATIGQVTQSLFLKPSELPEDFVVASASKITKAADALMIHDPLLVNDVRLGDDRFGSLFHNAMAATYQETLAGNPCSDIIAPLIVAWGFSERILAADLEKTNKHFMAWTQSKFGATSAMVKTELPILIPIETPAGLQWVRGQIDMIIECEDKIVVIDHKTSTISQDKLAAYSAKYFEQLSLYCNSMKYYSDKPVEAWLYYPMAGACVKCEL